MKPSCVPDSSTRRALQSQRLRNLSEPNRFTATNQPAKIAMPDKHTDTGRVAAQVPLMTTAMSRKIEAARLLE